MYLEKKTYLPHKRKSNTKLLALLSLYHKVFEQLYEVIMEDDSSTVKALLADHPISETDTDKSGWPPLHIAAGSLNTEVAATLVASGANINFASPTCGRAPSKASRILGVNTACIRLPLGNGASVNTQDHEEQTAIHEACSGGRKEVDLLLEYKADTNSLTRDGQSPLSSFLQCSSNLKDTALLNKLLGFSYPLKLRDNQAHLPTGLLFSEFQMLKDFLITLSQKLLSLQDICKITIIRIYGENNEHCLKNRLPVTVWKSLYNYQNFGQ
ncbi:LOW QUALITY PROTEIN: ankyrin repeat domain-containing protein 61 [Ciconia maguari]